MNIMSGKDPAENEPAPPARPGRRSLPAGVSLLVVRERKDNSPAERVVSLTITPVRGDLPTVSIEEADPLPAVLARALAEVPAGLIALADRSIGDDELAALVPLAKRFDVVTATRPVAGGNLVGRAAEWGDRQLTRLLLGVSGRPSLLLIDRDELRWLLPESDESFAFSEICSRAGRRGLSRTEVTLEAVAEATAAPLRRTKAAVRDALRYWWNDVLHAPADDAAQPPGRGWIAPALIFLYAAVMLFANLSHPLIEPDEGRHAEIAREMYATGDWLVPHFSGEPYYDKPPMFYWLAATSYRLFGVSERSARLVPAMAMMLTIVGTYFWGRRRFGRRAAAWGTGILALCPGVMYVGRFVVLDATLNLWIFATLALAYEAVDAKRLRIGFWIAAAACCGLGFLTKGPIALALTVPPLFVATGLDRGLARPRILAWIGFVGIAVLIAAPWFVAVIQNDPAYARYFFWEHNVARFLSGANHPKPIWFYVPVIGLACLPWSLLLIPMAAFLVQRSEAMRRQRPRGLGFLVLWAGWCIGFFTLSSGKLPTYVLPAVAPIALLLGVYLDRVLFSNANLPLAGFARRFVPRYGAATVCWTGLVVGIGLPLLGLADLRSALPMIGLWAICLFGLGIVWWRIRPRAAYATCGAFVAIAVACAAHGLLPMWAEHRTMFADMSQVDRSLADPSIPVGCWGNEWGAVPFYLRRNDVQNFERGGLARVMTFMESNDRAFLLLKGEYEISRAFERLPPGKTLTPVIEVGDRGFGATARATLFYLDGEAPIFPPDVARTAVLPLDERPNRL
jgi:dolichol-phosphate mannosyltransferase